MSRLMFTQRACQINFWFLICLNKCDCIQTIALRTCRVTRLWYLFAHVFFSYPNDIGSNQCLVVWHMLHENAPRPLILLACEHGYLVKSMHGRQLHNCCAAWMYLADGQGSCLNYVLMCQFLNRNWLKQMQLERKCVVSFHCAIYVAYVSFVYESSFGDRLDPYIRWLLVLVAVWWHGKWHQIKSSR